MRNLDELQGGVSRKSRTIAVVAGSLLLIAGLVIAKVHPPLPAGLTAVASPSPNHQRAATSGPVAGAEQPIGLQFLTRQIGWVFVTSRPRTSAAGLFATKDGGASWDLIFEGPPGSFHFFDAANGVLTSGTTFLTSDGGKSWRPVSRPPEATAASLAFLSPTDALALGVAPLSGGGTALRLYRTTDAGTTWTVVVSGTPDAFGLTESEMPFLTLGYPSPSLAWVSAFSAGSEVQAVAVSRDGGMTWRRAPLQAPGPGLAAPAPLLAPAGDHLTALASWGPKQLFAGPNGSVVINADVVAPAYEYTLGVQGWTRMYLVDASIGFSSLSPDGPDSAWVALGNLLCHVTPPLTSCHGALPSEPQSFRFLQQVGTDLLAVDFGTQLIVASGDRGSHWTIVKKPAD